MLNSRFQKRKIAKEAGLILIGLLYLMFFDQVLAQQADFVTIEADNLVYNEKKGITYLSGNVVLKKGSLIIKACSLKGFGRIERLDKIEAEKATVEDKKRSFFVQGDRIEYVLSLDRFKVLGNACFRYPQQMIVVYSDSLEGSINNEHFVAKGKVKIEKNNLLANCRTCTYYGKKGLVIMEEEINLKTETFSLKGKKATYNLKTSSLRIEGSVSGHINLRGLKGSLSEDKDE